MTRTAIITGGGSGIGKAIAKALHAEGFGVALLGRRAEVLRAAANEFDASGKTAIAIPADIGRRDTVLTAFDKVAGHFGHIDLVVNNAGMNAPALPLEDLDEDQWNAVVSANLSGSFYCTQAAFRHMKTQTPQGGRIINNGSISATTPRPLSAPYAATKHAITGLTKASALDGRPYNIAVGQIDIGNAGTDMTQRMSSGVLQADGSTATEPTIDVDHIARAVVYMAGLPLDANVLNITVMATQMPFVGRG